MYGVTWGWRWMRAWQLWYASQLTHRAIDGQELSSHCKNLSMKLFKSGEWHLSTDWSKGGKEWCHNFVYDLDFKVITLALCSLLEVSHKVQPILSWRRLYKGMNPRDRWGLKSLVTIPSNIFVYGKMYVSLILPFNHFKV